MSQKKKVYYVDNDALYEAIVQHKAREKKAREEGKPLPVLPNYIGTCIYEIATRMASKSNFYGYPFSDEMVGDAIENGVYAIHAFDPEKTRNPFGYLSVTVYYAFLRRIQKEKKGLLTKYKLAESMISDVDFAIDGTGEKSPLEDVLSNPYMQSLAKMHESSDEEKAAVKKGRGVWKKRND